MSSPWCRGSASAEVSDTPWSRPAPSPVRMSGTKDDSINSPWWIGFTECTTKVSQKKGWFNNSINYLINLQNTKFWVEHCAVFWCATSSKSSPFRKGWRWVRRLVWKKSRQTVCRKCLGTLFVQCFGQSWRFWNLRNIQNIEKTWKSSGEVPVPVRQHEGLKQFHIKVMNHLCKGAAWDALIFSQNLLWWFSHFEVKSHW